MLWRCSVVGMTASNGAFTPAPPVPAPTDPRHRPEPWTTLTFEIRFGSIPLALIDYDDRRDLGEHEPIGWWIVGVDPSDFDEFLPYQLEPYGEGETDWSETSWEGRRDRAQEIAAAHFEKIVSRKLGKAVEVTGWTQTREVTSAAEGTRPAGYIAKMATQTHAIRVVYAGSDHVLTITNLTALDAEKILKAFENGARVVSRPYGKSPLEAKSIDNGGYVSLTRYINLRQVEQIDHIVEAQPLDVSTFVGLAASERSGGGSVSTVLDNLKDG